jgi:arsenical pump membrane protein
VHEALALAALAVVLLAAVRRPRGWSEATVAAPVAIVLLLAGTVSWTDAADEVGRLGPVVGFLAAVLAIADACAADGLFAAVGAELSRVARGSGVRLLVGVFAAAAVTTAVLSLDTTVVLLTPVVVATAAHAGLRLRPHAYATAHLANTGSLLLPVSNLTNLLALAVVPVSFARFAALMALPWTVAVLVELGVFLVVFRRDLRAPAADDEAVAPAVPVFVSVVVALTLGGFVATSFVHAEPVWVAGVAAGVLAVRRLVTRRATFIDVARSTAPAFCVFVLALGVVVRAASDHGLHRVVDDVLPVGSTLPALLAVAFVSAALANVVNNLPAVLLVLPVVSTGGVAPVLAALVGVNIGPNLAVFGSLATLLWRRSLAAVGSAPSACRFTRIGLLTTPPTLAAATVAVWLSVRWVHTG